MAKRRNVGKLRQYSENDMHQALLAARGGEPVASAARRFGVPRVTLMDRLSGRVPDHCKMGRKTILTAEEEDTLVRWILTCRTKGFPITADELITSVSHLVKELGRETPFTDSMPGKKWYSLFMKRHPQLALREAQNLTASRGNITQQRLESWFHEVRQYFEENDLLQVLKEPSRLFNCDESAFFLCPKKGKVIVGKGDKTVYNLTGNNERENLTVLLTCCADGTLTPSLVVYPHERLPNPIVQSFPDEWGIGKSETGWMTSELFYEFMANVFEPHLTKTNTKRPVIMFMDGHRSHMTLHLSQFCSSKGIELVALLPNATHILQPLDVAVFHPLKTGWKKGVTKWRLDHDGAKLKKEDFAPLLKDVLQDTIKTETIKNGFKACGLLDLDPKNVDMSKLIGKEPKQVRANNTNVHEVRDHLMYLEQLIGGSIPQTDVSLFRVWQEMNNRANIQQRQLDTVDEPDLEFEQPNGQQFNDQQPNDQQPNDQQRNDQQPNDQQPNDHQPNDQQPNDQQPNDQQPIIVATGPSAEDIEDIPVELNENFRMDFNIDDPMIELELDVIVPNTDSFDVSIHDLFPSPEKNELRSSIPTPIQHCQPHTPTSYPTPTLNLQPHTPTPTPYPNGIPATSSQQPVIPEPSGNQENSQKTPVKINTPPNVPSPFKNALFWPGSPKSNAAKKKKKILTPSVITSKSWKDYHKKIAEEKSKKEKEIAERKAIREAKLKIKKEKEDKIPKRKKQKLCEEEELVDDVLAEPVISENILNLECISATSAVMPENIQNGRWVVVKYQEEKTLRKNKYIGQIIKKEESTARVKFLIKKGQKYVWPNIDDIDDVPFSDIIFVLNEPIFDRWGYLTFKNQ